MLRLTVLSGVLSADGWDLLSRVDSDSHGVGADSAVRLDRVSGSLQRELLKVHPEEAHICRNENKCG